MKMMYHHVLCQNMIPQVNLYIAFIYDIHIQMDIYAVIIEHENAHTHVCTNDHKQANLSLFRGNCCQN